MAAGAQTCAIGIITILIALYAMIYAIRYTQYDIRNTRYEIRTFMQNKPNLLDAQINVSSFITKHYENARLRRLRENKPKQTQFLKIPDKLSSQLEVVIEVFGPAGIAKSPPIFPVAFNFPAFLSLQLPLLQPLLPE